MGDFGKQLGHGNIIQPSVGFDVDLRNPTPEQQLRLQQMKDQLAEQKRQRDAIAAASAAASPRPQTYKIPVPGEPNMTPVDALGPINQDPSGGYSMTVTRSGLPSYTDMVNNLPPNMNAETRFMAMTALEKFAKPGGDASVPADVERERSVANIMTMRPDMSRAEAAAVVDQGVKVPPMLSPEQKAEKQAEVDFRKKAAAKAIIDPRTGGSADPSTARGALLYSNEAEGMGASKSAQFYRNMATNMRGAREEDDRAAAEREVPGVEAALRKAVNDGNFNSTQQAMVADVIAMMHSTPRKGLDEAHKILDTITREQLNTQRESRYRDAEARRSRNEASLERMRAVSMDHVRALTTAARAGGAGGREARQEISALRADLVADRSGLNTEMKQLTDATIKDADLGYTSEERKARIERVRAGLADVQRKIQALPELRAEGKTGAPAPPAAGGKEQLSRASPRYKAARAKGITDEEMRAHGLELVP